MTDRDALIRGIRHALPAALLMWALILTAVLALVR